MFLRVLAYLFLCLLLSSCGSTRWTHPNLTQSKFDVDVSTCRYQAQAATYQQPRQETYEQSLQRGIAMAQMDPAARANLGIQNSANQLGNSIGAALNASAIFDQCMFQAGYRKQ